MLYSAAEGEKKPLKCPVMFRSVDLVLVDEADAIIHLGYDLKMFDKNLRAVNADVTAVEMSAHLGSASTTCAVGFATCTAAAAAGATP